MRNHSLIIDLDYFQFGPSILGIYILVPELLKHLQFGPVSFWTELRMVYG